MTHAIVLFRRDLRTTHNPALYHASQDHKILPIFILDNKEEFKIVGASRLWLHHSLKSLDKSLNHNMQFFCGDTKNILSGLIKKYNIDAVYWNRCYEPAYIEQDTKIKAALQEQGIQVKSFNARLIKEPWELLKDDDTPYRVFTPFYKKNYLQNHPSFTLLDRPQQVGHLTRDEKTSLDALKLLTHHNWEEKILSSWQVGEQAAQDKLLNFIDTRLHHYKRGRDYPAINTTSVLSPHLHFGEISPQQIWQEIETLEPNDNTACFLSELVWREFAYYILYHFPTIPDENMNKKFNHFPWNNNIEFQNAWQKGETGIPIVDAGMRELWQTGTMHNRVRMIVASFLIKNLGQDWRFGKDWFDACLFDADLASNSFNWQWVAGCGLDAAPYFRIFNPILQGQKFDTNGDYTRRFVPELKHLPTKYLFTPWLAPRHILQQSGLQLDTAYPNPIVDLSKSRDAALDAYKAMKSII
ncbi:MAG TPA: deoxyribodipyrimidine photolyase [Holosporales bacterium]|nr:deoxyribodipyrimidine photolyase [Holosporales bacterium]